ncbi:MAG: IS3 family transposase, partial [Mycoplasmataceae bacterium]|nr:IS3 family transposase [Mycoplasmataceae bacterium]
MKEKRRKRLTKEQVVEKTSKEQLVIIIDTIDEILKEKKIKIKKEIIKRLKDRNLPVFCSSKLLNCNEKLYYRKPKNLRRMKKDEIKKLISETHKLDPSLGCRGINNQMNHAFFTHHSKDTILKYMKELDIQCKKRRKFKRYDPKDTEHGFKNLVNGKFKTDVCKEQVCTDITYIKTPHVRKKIVYLNGYIDCFNNEVFGVIISTNPTAEFVCASLRLLPLNKIHKCHQDHGSQYTSKAYMKLLIENSIKASMSGIGKSVENRLIENFWNILKKYIEKKLPYHLRTVENIQRVVTEFLGYYNKIRVQVRLGRMSPVEYGRQYSPDYEYNEVECQIFKPQKNEIDEQFEQELYNLLTSTPSN